MIPATEQTLAAVAADALVVLHVSIAAFVVLFGIAIFAGGALGWRWVRVRWLRLLHLALVGFIAAQAAFGALCPLTVWEQALRERAGEATYDGAFIAHWLGELLYVDVPLSVLAGIYIAFAALVIAGWWWVPPRPRQRTVSAWKS